MNNGSLSHVGGLTKAQKDAFIDDVPKQQIVRIEPTTTKTPYGHTVEVYAVVFRAPRDPATDGFAKELLILLGTLVTSIASFYFGTKAAAPATVSNQETAEEPDPLIESVDPTTGTAGGGPMSVRVSGKNLNNVKGLKIVSGETELLATGLKSNDAEAEGTLVISAGSPVGAWDVIVTDAAGKTSTLSDAFTVAVSNEETAEEPGPVLANIDPATGIADGEPLTVRVSGENLNDVKDLKIVSGETPVVATGVKSNDAEAEGTLVIPPGSPSGAWDVVVTDAAGKTATLTDGFTVA